MRSNACEMGQHADCGGNGDMFGCTCDCHLEPDAQLCPKCGEQVDGAGLCAFCFATLVAESEPPTDLDSAKSAE